MEDAQQIEGSQTNTAEGNVVLYVVVNAGFADEVMEIAREAGAKGATIINARGEGAMHKSFMGITIDSEREILIILIDAPTSLKIMKDIKEKAGLHSPAQAACFTIKIDKTTLFNDFSVL